MTVDAQTTSGGISGTVAFGVLALLPVAFCLRSRRRLFLHIAVFVLAAFVLTYWTSPRPRSRYYIVVISQGAILTAAGMLLLRRYSAPGLVAARIVVLASVVSGLAAGLVYCAPFVMEVAGLTPTDEFLSRATDYYETYRWMDENLPADATVLVAATNDLYYCPRRVLRLGLDDAYTHSDSRALFGLDAPDVGNALSKMRTADITHLFAETALVEEYQSSTACRLLAEMLATGALTKVYEADDTPGTRTPGRAPAARTVAVYKLDYRGAQVQ